MPRLLLLRHAKSSWDDPDADDFARPLSSRGRRAAPLMGRHIAEHGLLPQKILCSTARRTRETLGGILPYLSADMEVRLTRDLYETSEDRYIDLIRAYGATARCVMLIGHNPSIQQAALTLIESGNPSLVEEIEAKFPTAALAVLDFEARRWIDVEAASGRVVAFFRPRELRVVGEAGEEADE